MSEQPEWELVVNIGDIDPIEHGGKFVLRDKTGRYAPAMEVLSPLYHRDDEWVVFRFNLKPHTFVNGVLSDNPYHPDKPVWYADDIDRVAETVGMAGGELIELLCSAAPEDRGRGYECLFDYYGPDNFDSYPLDLDREEVEERYSQAPYNEEV